MGGASAMEDSVALANAIHSVARSQTGRRPSKKDVTDTLQQYQDERKPRLKKIHDESAFVTRLQSYDTWFLYLLMRWILPLIGLGPIVHSVSKLGSQGPRLKYVTVDEQQGTIPWLYPQPKTSTKAAIA
jgi:2-polyprenyl-6-methoxyphenol hydroxylase-like FAD-dependent oxidoreductase